MDIFGIPEKRKNLLCVPDADHHTGIEKGKGLRRRKKKMKKSNNSQSNKYKCKYCKMYISSFEIHIYKGFCQKCFYTLGLDKEEKEKRK